MEPQTPVNDNIKSILEADNQICETRVANDNKEFFDLLKDKVVDDFQKAIAEKDVNKRIDHFADLLTDIDEFIIYLSKKTPDIRDKIKARQWKTGGFSKRLILEWVDKEIGDEEIKTEAIEWLKKEGERLGYPEVRISDGITQLAGKESWDKAISMADLREPYYSHFFDFLEAVKSENYGKKEER